MRIGVLLAMDEELEAFLATLEDVREEPFLQGNIFTGSIQGNEVLALKSGIGKVHAARTAALFIERKQPDIIISTGIAGGVESDLFRVVLPEGALQHDVDITAYGYAPGEIPGHDVVFPVDTSFRAKAAKALQEADIPFDGGLIASGDTFMRERAPLRHFEKENRIAACDMESAAIAQVAALARRPFLIVRAISDCLEAKDQLEESAERIEKAANAAARALAVVIRAV